MIKNGCYSYISIAIIILVFLAYPTYGAVINVSQGKSIQAAIDNANPSDTVLVMSGTYYECVNITKPLKLLGIDIGKGFPIVDARRTSSAIILSSNGITLRGFNFTNSSYEEAGIKVLSHDNMINNNSVYNNRYGIMLKQAQNNTLFSNNISNNTYSIILDSSKNNRVTKNQISKRLIERPNFLDIPFSEIETYKITEKPVYFLVNLSSQLIDASFDMGSIICFNCTNITIRDSWFENARQGIVFIKTNESMIENNTYGGDSNGIYLSASNNNTITLNGLNNSLGITLNSSNNNIISNNSVYGDQFHNSLHGLSLKNSNKNIIISNNLTENYRGMYIYSSDSNIIISNNCEDNREGICLVSSRNNTILNNKAVNNDQGIILKSSSNNKLRDNLMNENQFYGFMMDGQAATDFDNIIDNTNLIDGKPPLFLKNTSNAIIEPPFEFDSLVCFNCTNITIKNLNLSKNFNGISFIKTSKSKIENNTFSSVDNGIFLLDSNSNEIINNKANGVANGINLSSSEDNNISHNYIKVGLNGFGFCCICLNSSNNNVIFNNSASGYFSPDYGLSLKYSHGNKVLSNNITGNYRGICIYSSFDNIIKSNNCSDNDWVGIYLINSRNNTILDNNANNNGHGIILESSSSNRLRNNTIRDNTWQYNLRIEGQSVDDFNNDIDESNLIEKRSLLYLKNASNVTIEPPFEFDSILCFNCTNITVKNLNLSKKFEGISFIKTNQSIIENNTLSSNENAIFLYYSNNNIITNNNLSTNENGIRLESSSNNTIFKNIAIDNSEGIILNYSTNNNITANTVRNTLYDNYNEEDEWSWFAHKNSYCGINLTRSSYNILLSNNISVNTFGIYLDSSSKNLLKYNDMHANNYNFMLNGKTPSEFINDIDKTNLVDGKSILYLDNISDQVIDSSFDIGSLICFNCTNITAKELNLEYNGNGICFIKTNRSKIENNSLKYNRYGIFLCYSFNNSITRNNISDNLKSIYEFNSENNKIFDDNNFIYSREEEESITGFRLLSGSVLLPPNKQHSKQEEQLPNFIPEIKSSKFHEGGEDGEGLEQAKTSESLITSQSIDRTIENYLRNLPSGFVIFNPPTKMNLSQEYPVEAIIPRNYTGNLTENLIGPGEPKRYNLTKVGPSMGAQLSGSAFNITPVGEKTQNIIEGDYCKWTWTVSPKESGPHFLTLTITTKMPKPPTYLVESIRQYDYIRNITIARQEINTVVSVPEKALNILDNIYARIMGIILLLAGILGLIKSIRDLRKDNKKE
jgi:parallel beta-helix repeat protein